MEHVKTSTTTSTATPACQQNTVGANSNQGMLKMQAPVFSQPKLTIGAPDDVYEKEADAMADKVMLMQMPGRVNFSSATNSVQRKCAHCEAEEQKMQRKEKNREETTVNSDLESYVGNLNTGGEALPKDVRSFYEPRFGCDFSNVKIHNSQLAAKSADSINALAYTSGNNVVFNSGQYNTTSDSGKRLLAHELTHVVQQGNVNVSNTKFTDSQSTSRPGFMGELDEMPVFAPNAIPGESGDAGIPLNVKPPAAPSCTDVCNRAYANASLNGGGGGVVCDGTTKCACVFDVPPLTRGQCPDFDAVVLTHENRHLGDVDCNASGGLHRPPFRDQSAANASECAHRRSSIAEMDALIPTATGACKTGMTSIRSGLSSWVAGNCT